MSFYGDIIKYVKCVKQRLTIDHDVQRYIKPFIERVVYAISVSDGRVLLRKPELLTDIILCFMIMLDTKRQFDIFGSWKEFGLLFSHYAINQIWDQSSFFDLHKSRDKFISDIISKMKNMYILKLEKCTSIEHANNIRDKEREHLDSLGVLSFCDYNKKWVMKKKYAYVDHYSLETIGVNEEKYYAWRVKKCTFGHISVNTCTSCTPTVKCGICIFKSCNQTYCKCGKVQERVSTKKQRIM